MTRPSPNNPEGEPSPAYSIVLYALLSFAAFFRCLILGQAYFDNDLLAQFGPWRMFLREQLLQGHFPLWNPCTLGGQPFFADLQNMMAYPVNYLTLAFPTAYGLGVFFFLHFFWAAWGADLWLGSLGLSGNARRAGGLVFGFSNYFWLEIIHPPVLAALAWLPWLFAALERLAQDPRPRRGFWAGLCFAMLFLCGSFQVSVGAFYAGAAYFLFRLLGRGGPFTRSRLLTFMLSFLFLIWGSLPLLGQLIPTAEFAHLSVRGESLDYSTFNARLSMEPFSLHQILFPRFQLPPGTTLDHAVQSFGDDGSSSWLGDWGYLGVWIPLLVLGAFSGRTRALALFLSGLALAGLGLALGRFTPVHSIFCAWVPGFSLLQAPFRFLFLYVLSASGLAAMGFERLGGAPPGGRWPKTLLALGALLLVFSFWRWESTWREILGLGLGLATLAGMAWPGPWRKAAQAGFQAALFLPLLLNGWGDFPTGPASNFDFRSNSKSLPEISGDIRPRRVLFGNGLLYPIQTGGKKYVVNYPQEASVVLGLKNFTGYNPLALMAKKDISRLPLPATVQLGALQGILTMDPNLRIPGFQAESHPPFTLYRWKNPLPLVYAPGRVEVIPSRDERLARMESPGFDLGQDLLLSAPPQEGWRPPAPVPAAPLSCSLESEGTDEQSFSIELGRDAWVVFTEVNYPGWKAYLDGRPTPVFTGDHLLRSVFMPAGKHRLAFRFEPVWLKPIAIGLIIWLLITLSFFKWFPRE
ncbi:MAG TPA: hypothetical protein VMV05_12620 [bacterium]|nr:hypothetical protein [bacterium]